jgi:hypothetical protein
MLSESVGTVADACYQLLASDGDDIQSVFPAPGVQSHRYCE